MQIKNGKDWPEVYSCKFLEAGIVSYEDSGAGIALLKKETIDKMKHTFIGRPVIIDHQNVTPENYDKVAVGYVINVRFNSEDAWFYADFIITDDEARALIDDKGYSVSCAYNVLDVAEGGLWHDIKFDGEITDGSFTHLALVNSPRYEDSKITKQLPAMLVNGKTAHYLNNQEESEMSIFKLFKKKENEKQEDASALHVALNDKAVPLADVLRYCINGKKLEFENYAASNDKEKYVAKDEDIVDMNGNTVSIGELKACYLMKSENEKKNSDDKKMEEDEAKNEKEEEEKKKAEEDKKNAKEEEEKKAKEDEEKKNAAAEEEKAKEEEKKNSKAKSDAFFLELSNASKNFDALENESGSPAPKTRAERAAEFRAKTNKKS